MARTETDKKSSYLFHYTTAEGLRGIVGDLKIWASNIFSFNDASEFIHGRDALKKGLVVRFRGR